MRKYKNKNENIIDDSVYDETVESTPQSEEVKEEEKDKFDPNALEIVLDRVQHGLVGTLKIDKDETNKPLFKEGDFVHFIAPAKLDRKNFILYKNGDSYSIRRIIKFVNDDIYVAGDNEREYHIVHKEEVIGKAIGRQRKKKYLSFSLNDKKKFYTFKKVNLAKFRLGNRVMNYDEDLSQESYEIAMQKLEANTQQQTQTQVKPQYSTDIDLDSELVGFLNPDDLVKEIRNQNIELSDQEYNREDAVLMAEEFIEGVVDNENAPEEVVYEEENEESMDESDEEIKDEEEV